MDCYRNCLFQKYAVICLDGCHFFGNDLYLWWFCVLYLCINHNEGKLSQWDKLEQVKTPFVCCVLIYFIWVSLFWLWQMLLPRHISLVPRSFQPSDVFTLERKGGPDTALCLIYSLCRDSHLQKHSTPKTSVLWNTENSIRNRMEELRKRYDPSSFPWGDFDTFSGSGSALLSKEIGCRVFGSVGTAKRKRNFLQRHYCSEFDVGALFFVCIYI